MSKVDYVHAANLHSVEGARAALPFILELTMPKSLLDVGCGTGIWLNAALQLGLKDILGVDGVRIAPEELLVSPSLFKVQDLTAPFSLGRTFDLALCLEVAEHIYETHAETLMDSLTRHAKTVVFSAGSPFQPGQHHVNGQWPTYWQTLFNKRGYVCLDELRPVMWDDARIEPWYRQNIFVARLAPREAGNEPRLQAMIHPDLIEKFVGEGGSLLLQRIRAGKMPMKWYFKTPLVALKNKLLKGRSKCGAPSIEGIQKKR